MTEHTEGRAPTPLDDIAEAMMAESAALHPELRVVLGIEGDTAEFSDYSAAGIAADEAFTKRVLERVRAEKPQDEIDAVTHRELIRTLELALREHEAKVALCDVRNIASPVQGIRDIFDLMPTETDADWDAIARRMANVPAAIDGYIETLRTGAVEGIVAAKRQVREVIEQTARYGEDGGFFDRLRPAESVPDALASALDGGAEKAKGAYRALHDFFENEYLDAATDQDGVGRERYALASEAFVGAKIDLDETYEWGLAELQRMVDEQEAIANEILPGASVKEAIAFLEQDDANKLHGTDALQPWMQEKADGAIDALAGEYFDIPEPLRAIECMIAPTQEGGIYYTAPTDDFSRPGRMWWSVPEGVTEFDTWRELTTVYHEGVPGHHLQLAQAVYNKGELNTWRRSNFISGHGEGWALYAERLMDQLGFLETPADRLGMLDGQRMRAARVVLDIGVHLGKEIPEGGKVWDYDYAIEFMTKHCNMNDGFIRFEVNRYFGWPGQAPSYKVGQRVWEEVRDEVKKREGDSFDLRDFHRRALALGAVGLDTLRWAMLEK